MTPDKKVEPAPLVPPFVRFVASAIPMVFDDSLSYYECLAALTKYMQDVADVVNNNGAVTEEYIQMTKDMKSYMDNYFDNLDVQEEINNKLDAMVEDGSFQAILDVYVEPRLTEIEGELNELNTNLTADINNEASIRASNDSDLQSQISALASGAPIPVDDVSEMTDTTKIYVNTTNGHWYYYANDQWNDAGVYQSSGISSSDPVIVDINTRLENTSFYDQRKVVVNGLNLIRSDFIHEGYWINSSGQKVTNASSKYAVVPVCGGNHILLCLNKTFTTYTSAALGGIVLLDKNLNTLNVLAYENVVLENIYYNTFKVCDIELSSDTAYIMFTTKLATAYDVSSNAIIVYGSIDDFTVENYAVNLYEMPVEIAKIYNQNVGTGKTYSNLTWAVFGDSLTEVNSTAVKKYYDYISDHLGMNIENYGASGTGYRSGYDDGTCFYQRMANIDPDDFDFLTIFGSGNDIKYLKNNTMPLGTANDYCGVNQEPTTIAMAINRTLEQYYALAPTKPIGLITPTPWYAYCTGWRMNRDDAVLMQNYADLIIEIGKIRGIPVLDLFNCSNLRPWDINCRVYYYNENGVQDGGTHPNSRGHKLISASIEEFVKSMFPQK